MMKEIGHFITDALQLEIIVIVPDEPDRREQLHAAVKCFEDAMAVRLRGVIDPSRRLMEGEQPRCKCGQVSTWARTTLLETYYFCDAHASLAPDFSQNEPDFGWQRIERTTT
jgi:hypothetical protein